MRQLNIFKLLQATQSDLAGHIWSTGHTFDTYVTYQILKVMNFTDVNEDDLDEGHQHPEIRSLFFFIIQTQIFYPKYIYIFISGLTVSQTTLGPRSCPPRWDTHLDRCLSRPSFVLSCSRPSPQTRVTLLRQMAFCLAELHLWSTKSSLQVKGSSYHHVQSPSLSMALRLSHFVSLCLAPALLVVAHFVFTPSPSSPLLPPSLASFTLQCGPRLSQLCWR